MSTSALPAVLDALVTTFTTALPGVQVIDGPYVTTPDGDYLTVGWTPVDEVGAEATQEWRAFKGGPNVAPPRKETFDVACYVDSFGGDTDAPSVKARRDGAYVLLAAVENALRGDLTLGGAVGSDGWVELTTHQLHQVQAAAGYVVGITFHVTGYARI